MLYNIENFELVNVLQGLSAIRRLYTDRPSHAFIFKISGQSVYTFCDSTLTLSQGEMLFIPRGTTYTVARSCPESSRYVLINFLGETALAAPAKVRLDDRVDFSHLCRRLCKCCVQDTPADRFRALALCYEILAVLAEGSRAGYMPATALARIDPAVEYLMDRLFDRELNIGSLHTLCGLSDTYFRKLFIARFGIGPKQYVRNKRLTQAKAILTSGECGTVAEAASLVGFDDPLYFSRVFKQHYGFPPSDCALY